MESIIDDDGSINFIITKSINQLKFYINEYEKNKSHILLCDISNSLNKIMQIFDILKNHYIIGPIIKDIFLLELKSLFDEIQENLKLFITIRADSKDIFDKAINESNIDTFLGFKTELLDTIHLINSILLLLYEYAKKLINEHLSSLEKLIIDIKLKETSINKK